MEKNTTTASAKSTKSEYTIQSVEELRASIERLSHEQQEVVWKKISKDIENAQEADANAKETDANKDVTPDSKNTDTPSVKMAALSSSTQNSTPSVNASITNRTTSPVMRLANEEEAADTFYASSTPIAATRTTNDSGSDDEIFKLDLER